MAAVTVDKVVVELEAKIDKYNRDVTVAITQFNTRMETMENRAKRTERAVNSSFAKINRGGQGLLGAIGFEAFRRVASRALEYAASLDSVSKQLNVTTRDLQVLRYAASQNGITQAQLDEGLNNLVATLGRVAAGAKAPTAALNAIGIEAKDIEGLDTGAAFRKIADGLKPIPDRASRAAVEVALFGEAGAKLDTLLEGGSSKIDSLAAAADRLGIVLSDQQIQNADKTANKLSDLKQVLEARIAGTVADNADSILSLANALSSLATSVLQFLSANPVKAAAILGALGGGVVGGPVGAAGGALAAAGYASQHTEAGLRSELNFLLKSRRNYYVQAGGTEEELQTGRLNPAIVMKLQGKAGFKEYNDKIAAVRRELATLSGGGPVAAPEASGSGGGGSIGNFLAPNPRTPRDNSRRLARAQYNAERDELRAQSDILAAQADLSHDIKERAVIAEKRLAIDARTAELEIAYNLKVGDISSTQAEKQRKLNATLYGLERERIKQDEAYDLMQERIRQHRLIADAAIETKEMEARLAKTREERLRIEQEIIKAKYAELRRAEQDVIDDPHSSPEQKNAAGRRQIQLEKQEAGAIELTRRDNESPMERYRRELRGDFESINDQLENIQVDALRRLTDELTNASTKALGLKGALGDIVGELIRIGIQRQLIGPLADALFGPAQGGQGSGSGGFFNTVIQAAATAFGGPRAKGGPVSAGKAYLVGENGPELFAPGQSGTIIPQGKAIRPIAGAVSPSARPIVLNQTINIDASGSVNPQGYAEHIRASVREETAQIVQAASRKTMQAVPGRISQFQKLNG